MAKSLWIYQTLLSHSGLALELANPDEAWIGDLRPNTRHQVTVPRGEFTGPGVTLNDSTLLGSPLYNAGIDRGDRILSVDGHEVKSEADLRNAIERHKPGDVVHLKVEGRTGARDVEVKAVDSPRLHIVMFEEAGRQVTPDMLAFRTAWLSSKAIHPLPKLEKYCPKCRRTLPFEYANCPFDGTRLDLTLPKAK